MEYYLATKRDHWESHENKLRGGGTRHDRPRCDPTDTASSARARPRGRDGFPGVVSGNSGGAAARSCDCPAVTRVPGQSHPAVHQACSSQPLGQAGARHAQQARALTRHVPSRPATCLHALPGWRGGASRLAPHLSCWPLGPRPPPPWLLPGSFPSPAWPHGIPRPLPPGDLTPCSPPATSLLGRPVQPCSPAWDPVEGGG